jgi:hypothetical protein
MQKGSLDREDYGWLLLIVLAYFTGRPYIERFFKWWFYVAELQEGEEVRREYYESMAKVGPNSIRVNQAEEPNMISEASGDASASGSKVDNKGQVTNRKTKDKSGVEKLMDWDDEPAREPTEGDKSDVVKWLDKWSDE